jgi:hypothetical protein
VVPRLFLEADGLYVRLQREKQKHRELKMAIGYEGWERLPQARERYRLVGKRVYCQGSEEIDFWEGAILALGRQWDWSRIPLVVLNGDGARWIDERVQPFERAIRQLDGFHLARSCYQAGGEAGPELYWYVSTTLAQFGLEFREENARFMGWDQRLLYDSQVLGRVKGRFALRP